MVTVPFLVLAPDPNRPQRRSRDTGSDPRWGWFGSGTETMPFPVQCEVHTPLSPSSQGRAGGLLWGTISGGREEDASRVARKAT